MGESHDVAHGAAARERAADRELVQSYRTNRTRAGHVAFLVACWLLFLWLWWRVLDRPGSASDVTTIALQLGVLVLTVGVLTWMWIAHNVAVARRRAGRRSGAVPLVKPTADRLGRRLEVGPESGTASYVVVRVEGSVKRFLTEERVGG